MIKKHLIHRNSNDLVDGKPKLPTSDDILYGEIAINYAKDNETIIIKNSNDEIIKFSAKGGDEFVAKSGDTMTGALNIQSTLNVGINNTISGEYAIAQGSGCTASGIYSRAEGRVTTATGRASHAEGYETIAKGDYSHAEGSGTTAIGNFSHAEGDGTIAHGYYSHAEGTTTQANGYYSHAEGLYTEANGQYSHAEGESTIANNNAEHANGSYNVSIQGATQALSALTKDATATLFSVGNGDSDTNRKNAFEVKYNGDTYISGNTKCAKGISANTISATTITSPTIDAKQDLLVSGTNIKTINGTTLLGNGDIAISIDTSDRVAKTGDTMTGALNIQTTLNVGSGNIIGTGSYTFAQGRGCEVSGNTAHAEGFGTKALGHYSHAEGSESKASGDTSHAEGNKTKSLAVASHAEGNETIASGLTSHAEGYFTQSNGLTSHAEGHTSYANGDTSHAEGYNTRTNNVAEHSGGSFNKSIKGASQVFESLMVDTNATLFSVGNGKDEATRRNTLEIKWNGDTYISGDTKFAKGVSANTVSASTITSPTIDAINTSITNIVDNVYTKDELNTALALKADKATTYTKTEVNNQLLNKANVSDVYTKLESDAALTLKADKTTTYTKVETDNKLLLKQDTLVSGTNIKTINGTTLLGSGDIIVVTDKTDKVSKSGDTMTGALNIQSTLNIGTGNTVTGLYAFAQGSGCTASGGHSHAEGSGTTANGVSSHAEGNLTQASGYSSHAEGYQTQASGDYSHAEGNRTKANGSNSHSEGYQTQANTDSSHAEGIQTVTKGHYSHAEGYGTITNNKSEHASGYYNVSVSGTNQELSALTKDATATLFSIGNGDSDTNRKNAFEIKGNGDTYITKSLNIGVANTVTGRGAFVQGSDCSANGTESHSEGRRTRANGSSSHSEGTFTEANGVGSHSEGNGTQAKGTFSHAEGVSTIANNHGEHASGWYNLSVSGTNQELSALTKDATATLFSVGNGDGEEYRKNALELKYNGDLIISGNFTQASDKRLKHNIRPLEDNILDKVMELKPSRYVMNNKTNEEIGFIAQEIEMVFPEFVETNVINDMKSVNYSTICSVLCKAIQELKAEIDVLKANQK